MLPTEESLVRTFTKLQGSSAKRQGAHSSELVVRKTNHVRRSQTKPIIPLPIQPKDNNYQQNGLGMKYFFNEKEIPKELDDILQGYKHYTDGMYCLLAIELENSHTDLTPNENVDEEVEYKDDFEPDIEEAITKSIPEVKAAPIVPAKKPEARKPPIKSNNLKRNSNSRTRAPKGKQDVKKAPNKLEHKKRRQVSLDRPQRKPEAKTFNLPNKKEQKKGKATIETKYNTTNATEIPEDIPDDQPLTQEKEILQKEQLRMGGRRYIEAIKTITSEKIDKCAATYDSATLDSAIIRLDLKLLCKCFAYALHKHIVFARGKALLSEITNDKKEPQDFAYKLKDALRINIPTKTEGAAYNVQEFIDNKERAESEEEKAPITLEKYKQLISESFSNLTGQYIPPEMLNSYLTLEGAEEDIDLNYTQNQLEDYIKSSIYLHNGSGIKECGF